MSPRRELNSHLILRTDLFYPLNYGEITLFMILYFFKIIHRYKIRFFINMLYTNFSSYISRLEKGFCFKYRCEDDAFNRVRKFFDLSEFGVKRFADPFVGVIYLFYREYRYFYKVAISYF